MKTYGLDNRLEENQEARNITIEQFGLIAILIGLLIGVSGYLNQHQQFWVNTRWLSDLFGDFYANVSSELISIATTVFILDKLNANRATQERKLALFRQAKSRSNDVAVEAFDQIQHDDLWDALLDYYSNANGVVDLSRVRWAGGIDLRNKDLKNSYLQNASLHSANLYGAKLQSANLVRSIFDNANLSNANLQGANLMEAYLRKSKLTQTVLRSADLYNAKLQSASLIEANLESAYMWGAELQKANLNSANLKSAELVNARLDNAQMRYANLENADLRQANLQSVDLTYANLKGAKIDRTTQFNEETILPDSQVIEINRKGQTVFKIQNKYWHPNINMKEYTDPQNSNFWKPSFPKKTRVQFPTWVTEDMLVDK